MVRTECYRLLTLSPLVELEPVPRGISRFPQTWYIKDFHRIIESLSSYVIRYARDFERSKGILCSIVGTLLNQYLVARFTVVALPPTGVRYTDSHSATMEEAVQAGINIHLIAGILDLNADTISQCFQHVELSVWFFSLNFHPRKKTFHYFDVVEASRSGHDSSLMIVFLLNLYSVRSSD